MIAEAHKRYAMVRFPRWKEAEITDGIAELAMTRTEHLGAFATRRPLRELLRDAYIQGCNDMMNVATKSQTNGETT